MNLIKNEKIEASKVELHFSVEQSVFEAACERAYKKEVSKINIPGFRKGKAPRAMIEKMYGKGFFYDTALNDILPEAYEAAVKEAGIDPVSQPEIDVLSIDEKLLAGLLLIWNVWDFLNDPIMGGFLDKAFAKKRNKHGKYRRSNNQ